MKPDRQPDSPVDMASTQRLLGDDDSSRSSSRSSSSGIDLPATRPR
jgi:hypothetical protein